MGGALDHLAERVELTRIFVAGHPRLNPNGTISEVDSYWKNIRTLGDLDPQEREAYESQVLQGVVPPPDPFNPTLATDAPFTFDLNDPVEFQVTPGDWEPGEVKGIFPPGTAPPDVGPTPDWATDRTVYKVVHPSGIEHIVAADPGVLRPAPPTVLPAPKRSLRDRLLDIGAGGILAAEAATTALEKLEEKVPGLGEWASTMGELGLETVLHSGPDGEQVELTRIWIPPYPNPNPVEDPIVDGHWRDIDSIDDLTPEELAAVRKGVATEGSLRPTGPRPSGRALRSQRLRLHAEMVHRLPTAPSPAHPPGYIDPETGPIEPGWGAYFLPSPATIRRTEAAARLHAKVRSTAPPPAKLAGAMRDLGASIRRQGFSELGAKVGNIGVALEKGSPDEVEEVIDEAFLEWRVTPQRDFFHAEGSKGVLSIREAQAIYNAIWDARLDFQARQPA